MRAVLADFQQLVSVGRPRSCESAGEILGPRGQGDADEEEDDADGLLAEVAGGELAEVGDDRGNGLLAGGAFSVIGGLAVAGLLGDAPLDNPGALLQPPGALFQPVEALFDGGGRDGDGRG